MGADSNPHWYKFYQKIYILFYIYATKNAKKLIKIIDNISNPFKYKTNTNTK